MNRPYHTDLDRDDFEPGELLPWQDMSRHLQALEYQFKILEGIIKTYFDGAPSKRIHNLEEKVATLEQALQTTTDSLKQAHEKIVAMEGTRGLEYKPVEESYEGECERCGRVGLLNKGGKLCKGCVLDDIMYPGRAY